MVPPSLGFIQPLNFQSLSRICADLLKTGLNGIRVIYPIAICEVYN